MADRLPLLDGLAPAIEPLEVPEAVTVDTWRPPPGLVAIPPRRPGLEGDPQVRACRDRYDDPLVGLEGYAESVARTCAGADLGVLSVELAALRRRIALCEHLPHLRVALLTEQAHRRRQGVCHALEARIREVETSESCATLNEPPEGQQP